jgi:ribosome-associated protein
VASTTPTAAVAPTGGPDAEALAAIVVASLDDSKAEDIVSLDIRAKSSLADVMIIASGRSHRHVGAIADRLIEDLKTKGVHDARVEGLAHCDWVLIDAGDVLVNVFRPEVRGFYNLEKMWAAEPLVARTPRVPEA